MGEKMKSEKKSTEAGSNPTLIIIALIGAIGGALTTWIAGIPARKEADLKAEQLRDALRERDDAKGFIERYRNKYENAPKTFVRELEKVIETAAKEIEPRDKSRSADPEKLIVNARTIVAVRNDLRKSLEAVGGKLNSEIDELAFELKRPKIDQRKVQELVQILNKKWPAKKTEIEVVVRKVIIEMGLTPDGP